MKSGSHLTPKFLNVEAAQKHVYLYGVFPSDFDNFSDLFSDCKVNSIISIHLFNGKRLVEHGQETVCRPSVVIISLLLESWDCRAC